MYKEKREARYQSLRGDGFAPFEARTLSKIPKSVPYLKVLTDQRKIELAAFRRSKTRDTSDKAWETFLVKRYIMKGWSKHHPRSSQEAAWEMLRHFEDKYKDDHPSYKSPWRTRQRDFRKAERKTDNALKIRDLKDKIEQAKKYNNDHLIKGYQFQIDRLSKNL
jgi:hypothetical protein